MGIVYETVDLREPSEADSVAVKVLDPRTATDPEIRLRFKMEGVVAQRLDHPNVVKVTAVLEDENGILYIAMERLQGESLRERLDVKKRLPADQVLTISEQVCSVLATASGLPSPILHRDLKPANIFFWPSHDSQRLKILDFGLAKISGIDLTTGPGAPGGSVAYIAPEILRQGEAPNTEPDVRADLYSLAVVIYECLTGSRPFAPVNPNATLIEQVAFFSQLHGGRHPALPKDSRITASLAAFFTAALDSDPNKRYATPSDFHAAFSFAASPQAGMTGAFTRALPGPPAEPASHLASPPTKPGVDKMPTFPPAVPLGLLSKARAVTAPRLDGKRDGRQRKGSADVDPVSSRTRKLPRYKASDDRLQVRSGQFAGSDILLVGGGSLAVRRLSELNAAGARVTVVAPSVSDEIGRSAVRVVQASFAPEHLEGMSFVVPAAPPDVEALIRRASGERGIMVLDTPVGKASLLTIQDLSAAGLSYKGQFAETSCLLWKGDPVRDNGNVLVDERPERLGVSNATGTIERGSSTVPVLVFDETTTRRLGPIVEGLERQGALVRDGDLANLSDETYSLVAGALLRCDEFKRRHILRWLRLNERVLRLEGGQSGWDAVLMTLRIAFKDYHVSRKDFDDHIAVLARRILEVDNWSALHWVPMRLPTKLAEILGRHHAVIEQYPNSRWIPSLLDLISKRPGISEAAGQNACLVVLDSFVNTGISRRAFLRLVRRLPGIVEGYKAICLAAVVGYEIADPDSSETQGLPKCFVKVGRTLTDRDRPSKRLRDPRIERGLREIALAISEPASEQATEPHPWKRETSLVTFYYACPFDSLPIFWSEQDHWTPLFKPLEYYSPGHRPLARAPFFSVYPRTLEQLRKKIENVGGPVLLCAPRGNGKTYVAARAVETTRANHYIFWHDCIEFEGIETLLARLDRFLADIGLPANPGTASGSEHTSLLGLWRSPHNERELAVELYERFSFLDRSAVIVLDRVQNISPFHREPPQDVEASSLWLFLKHLVEQFRAPGPLTLVAPTRPTLLLIAQTRPSFRRSTHVSAGDSDVNSLFLDPSLDAMCRDLQVPATQRMHCPADPADVREGRTSVLASRLVDAPWALERYQNTIERLSHSDPYKTWLACFWINRCARRHAVPNASAVVCAEIEVILDDRRARQFAETDFLHGVLDDRLESDEHLLLQIASAFLVSWRAEDLGTVFERVCQRRGVKPRATALTLLQEFVTDRAPYLVRLGEQNGNYEHPYHERLDSAGELRIGQQEQFEMPRVTAAYYERTLRDPDGRAIYEELASLIADHLEREDIDEQRKAALWVQRLLYLCAAGRPSDAALVYAGQVDSRQSASAYLRKHNSWDRIVEMGRAVFESSREISNSDLKGDLKYRAAVTYANALAETMRSLKDARLWCEQSGNDAKEAGDHYWQARLRLIEGKCYRYGGRYSAALRAYEDTLALLQKASEKKLQSDTEIASWRARTHASSSQCEMSLGHMGVAKEHIREARGAIGAVPSSADVEPHSMIVRGLCDRHEATLSILAGRLEEAYQRFTRLVSGAKTERIRAILLYKRSRALLELARSREVEDAELPSLDSARKDLETAEDGLRRSNSGDRKWYTAIYIARVERELLARRHAQLFRRTGEGAMRILEATLVSILDRMTSGEEETPNASRSEVDLLMRSCRYQAQLESLSSDQDAERLFETLVQGLKQSTHPVPHPHHVSRDCYERAYYLGELRSWALRNRPGSMDDRVAGALAVAYRAGVSMLYRHHLFWAGLPLHRLLLKHLGAAIDKLEERLEATLWLTLANSFPADGVRSLLDEIAGNALRHGMAYKDEFFVLPTKVLSRLLSDKAYDGLAIRGWDAAQPVRSQAAPAIRDAAKLLRDECLRWYALSTNGGHDTTRYWDKLRAQTGLDTSDWTERRQFLASFVDRMDRFWKDTLVEADPAVGDL